MRNPNRFFEGFCLILCLVADLSFFSCPVIIYFWCFGLLWLNDWPLVRQPEKGFSKKELIVFTLRAKVSSALYLIVVEVKHFSGFSNLGFFLQRWKILSLIFGYWFWIYITLLLLLLFGYVMRRIGSWVNYNSIHRLMGLDIENLDNSNYWTH